MSSPLPSTTTWLSRGDEPDPNPRKPASARPPVLPRTVDTLRTLSGQHVLDLRAVSETLLHDPGAVLRLYAHIADEFPEPEDRPVRLEECVASLQMSELLEALASRASVHPFTPTQQADLASAAAHAFTIARFSRAVAASLGLPEELAFYVGLLHATEDLPACNDDLAHPTAGLSHGQLAHTLASRHCLPKELHHALLEVHHAEPTSLWKAMVDAAHDLEAAEASR